MDEAAKNLKTKKSGPSEFTAGSATTKGLHAETKLRKILSASQELKSSFWAQTLFRRLFKCLKLLFRELYNEWATDGYEFSY